MNDIQDIKTLRPAPVSPEDVAACYPGARDAVLLQERVIKPDTWEAARESGKSPTEIVDEITLVVAESIARMELHGLVMGFTEYQRSLACSYGRALPQLSHPDFLSYIKAKMGAV